MNFPQNLNFYNLDASIKSNILLRANSIHILSDLLDVLMVWRHPEADEPKRQIAFVKYINSRGRVLPGDQLGSVESGWACSNDLLVNFWVLPQISNPWCLRTFWRDRA